VTDKIAAEVVAADDARLKAMTDDDIAALDRLMGENFFYTHNNGFTEGKKPYLDRMREGKVRYLNPRRHDVTVSVYGNAAVMNGRIQLDVDVLAEKRQINMNNLFMSTWVKGDKGWVIVGWASTPIPAAA